MSDSDIVIVSAKRSAIGNFNGSLASTPAHEIGSSVIKDCLNTINLEAKDISEVIMGQILTSGQGQNPARQAAIKAGIPVESPAWLVNQVCGSGLKSVALACQAIKDSGGGIIVAGGQENMSMCPHGANLRPGQKMGNLSFTDLMVNDGLTDAFSTLHMGVTAENLVKKYKLSREEQDQFSIESQHKAENAQKSGKFKDEITPIKIKVKREEVNFETDEFIRHGAKIDDLAKLRPAFDKDGSVTAGNASGINDGAAAVILMTRAESKKRGLKSLGTIVSFAQSGVEPDIMGIGPVSATQKALKKAGWGINDLDLIEANEAFAAQAISVNKELGWDTSKVNVNGGAVALGHPIGASGTRILVTLLHEMKRRNSKKGLATLCVGGGMGVAMCIQRD